MEVNGIANASINAAPAIYSYFSFSGQRVSHFDNYSIELEGGATVVTAGSPIVLTTGVSLTGSTITVDGDVTSDNGDAVTARGFCLCNFYGAEPTTIDNVINLGSGTGNFYW